MKERVIPRKKGLGREKFISHSKFKTWSKQKKKDSLDVLFTVTLHLFGEKKTEWVTNRS